MTVSFEVTYPGSASRSDAGPDFTWVDLVDPTEDALQAVATRFGLHPLAIADVRHGDHLPKADPLPGDRLFVIVRTVDRAAGEIVFGQVAIFVGQDHVVSIVRGAACDHAALRASLETVPEMLEFGVDYILHGILQSAAATFIRVVEQADEAASALEASVPDAPLDRDRIAKLLAMRREVKTIERMLAPMEETARKLAAAELPCIRADLAIYLRDIVDQVRRAQSGCELVRDTLAASFEYSALVEQVRTGTVTRQLAAWAAILAIPTAIAGNYGMNFRFMPELTLPYGYPAAVGLMLVGSVLLFWRFRRLGWL